MRKAMTIVAALLVSACSAGSGSAPTTSTPRPSISMPAKGSNGGLFRNPEVQRDDGAKVIGARADALVARFGQARIDLTEGDARKLQFVSASCVLDIFLYPLSKGAEPIATHIETRTRKDGARIDQKRCVQEVENRK